MKYPNFREEKKLYKKGYKLIVGVDEVGRGPLAGPVIACAITVPEFSISNLGYLKIRDSKRLSAKQREEIYKVLEENPDVGWGIGRVSEKVIDRINILEATKLAMQRAVRNLEKKQPGIDFLITDGNFAIKSPIAQKSVIKGDQKVFSVAAASIIAKVYRDRMMLRYDKKYPTYGFDRHKGYGTKLHRNLINKKGLCKIHRKTFKIS
jgi:ribonuclease HII